MAGLGVSMSASAITYPGTWIYLAASLIFTRLELSILIEFLREQECVSETG